MKPFMNPLWAAPLLLTTLAGCSGAGDAAPPLAVAMTEDAVGYYCQMYVLDHGGPKAQIHLKGIEQPLWFSQVTNAIDYVSDKERDRDIVAIYVSDMAKAVSWGEPGATNWIDANGAFFVIDSTQMGGMGTPEAIPFGSKADAESFVGERGGTVVAFADIPERYGSVNVGLANAAIDPQDVGANHAF